MTLDHNIPTWVADDAVFFITLCCRKRNVNTLAQPVLAEKIKESMVYRQRRHQWWVLYALLMPDHFHGLFMFSRHHELQRVIPDWKRFLARREGIDWQENYFDHRVRSDESLDDKIEYIRYNPVRQGLATSPEDWPYSWTGDDLR